MKLGKKVLLASAFAFTVHAQAAVDVKFAPGVEAMFVNGEQTFNLLETTKDVTLENGLNQLVVRISKLAEGQGQLEKYRSEPIVLTFTAKDQDLYIQPSMRILNAVDMKNFDDNPRMKVESKSGVSIDVMSDVLPKDKKLSTSNLLGRNYTKELMMYNHSKGYALVGEGEEVIIEPEPKALKLVKADPVTNVAVAPVAVTKTVKTVVTNVPAETQLKSLFSQLTPDQRKAFLGWAVTQ